MDEDEEDDDDPESEWAYDPSCVTMIDLKPDQTQLSCTTAKDFKSDQTLRRKLLP
jgi:hypothetical protein